MKVTNHADALMDRKRNPGWGQQGLTWWMVMIAASLFSFPAAAEEVVFLEPLFPAELDGKVPFTLKVANDTFQVDCSYGAITGEAVSEKERDDYLKLFLPEIMLYPSEFLRKAKIQHVVLCNGLKFAGQKRSAIPSWENNTLYYDVVPGKLASYKQLVIHHELFHMVDVHDDGKLYADDAWSGLLPEGFRYGSGGKNAQGDDTMSLLTDAVPGFVSKYATTGVEEDKAETFAHMLLHPRYMARRAEKEGLLEAKMHQMRRLLSAISSEMGTDFWTQVEAVSRPDDQ
ncbi:hypothetical protein AB1L30_13925 [Bremerella sp. JC817]|uniref:hypothetical protein n=1 Tax=Bremerella sp. JC817 TaxID=3231756 RepID=UPI00345A7074